MNKNSYFGLALAACLSIASTPLLAEIAPETSAPEPLEPSEIQRQQAEQNKANITAPAPATSTKEPLEPSELQREQEKNKEEHIKEPLEPSELQRQQAEHNKAIAK